MSLSLALVTLFLFQSGDELPDGWIGREACLECHEGEIGIYDTHVHGKAIALNGQAERACEACHGPGEEHEEDAVLENILGKADIELIAKNCIRCHAPQAGGLALRTPDHARAQVNCLECHQSGHKPDPARPMLVDTLPRLCAGCHQEQQAQFSLPFSHRDGREPVSCSDCHDVHGGATAKSLLAAPGRDACVRCHTGQAGPFVFPHPPRQLDGCRACHDPHGSNNPFQLTRADITQLCLECHADTPAFHDLSQPRYQPCTACHSAVHGSHRDPNLFEE